VENLLNTSPKCKRLKYERDMLNPEYTQSGKILFCNTTEGDSIFRIGNTYMEAVSDIQTLIGKNIVSCSCTEMAFLTEVMPEERVMKLLNEMVSRVQNRFGYNNPNVSIVIDSSPNSLETQADPWINKHKDDKDVLFVNDKKWELPTFSWMFPLYEKDKKNNVFPIFKGTATQPTKIITKEEVKNFNEDDIIWTPNDLYELAKDNVAKTMRDFGATPTAGSDTKLFTPIKTYLGGGTGRHMVSQGYGSVKCSSRTVGAIPLSSVVANIYEVQILIRDSVHRWRNR
jgi:hypothetical protein